MKTQEEYAREINICLGVPYWNTCTWRDENTIVSKEGKYILCHNQCTCHKCERLLRINTSELINID